MKERFELLFEGSSKILKINANKGDKYIVESGAMVSMSPSFDVEVKSGGIGKMFGRLLSGESAFIQEYKAFKEGELLLAPQVFGDIINIKLDNTTSYRISNGNFLACSDSVEIETKAKVRGAIGSGEGFVSLIVKGEGDLFVNSCGSIYKVNLEKDEEYIVDSSHLVLWNEDMKISTKLANETIAGSFFGGEGFIARLTGPGTIWIQTRKQIVSTS